MSDYYLWNERLLRHFFNKRNANHPVRISIDSPMLDNYFDDIGGSENFIQCLREGPEELKNIDCHFNKVKRLHNIFKLKLENYNNSKMEFDINEAPTYFFYLCGFCYAWNHETENNLPPNAYYKRLSDIFQGDFFHVKEMKFINESLWKSIERWSAVILGEKYGFFRSQILGAHKHVGLTKSQVIITNSRLSNLADVCFKCFLLPDHCNNKSLINRNLTYDDPTTQLDEKAFVRRMLGNEVANVLDSNKNEDQYLKDSIIDFISEFLTDWDGKPSGTTKIKRYGEQNKNILIRKGLKYLDLDRKFNEFYFIKDTFDEYPIKYKRKFDLEYKEITLNEYFDNEIISDINTNNSVIKSITLNEKDYILKLQSKKYRVFTKSQFNDKVFIEHNYRPRGTDFYIMVNNELLNEFNHKISNYEHHKFSNEFDNETHSLFWFKSLDPFDTNFPVKSLSNETHLKKAFFKISGNKLNELRKTFFDYDPPYIEIHNDISPENIEFELNGCHLNDPIDKVSHKRYITISEGADVVNITAHLLDKEGQPIDSHSDAFYVYNNPGNFKSSFNSDMRKALALNNFGETVDEAKVKKRKKPYIKGLNVYDSMSCLNIQLEENLKDEQLDNFCLLNNSSDIVFSNGDKFVEAISASGKNKSLTEIKSTYQNIYQEHLSGYKWDFIENLLNLGFYEVKENKYVWPCMISPNPLFAALTSLNIDNKYTYFLSGCECIENKRRLLIKALNSGIAVYFFKNEDDLYPINYYLVSEKKAKIIDFLNELNINASKQLSSIEISDFILTLDEYHENKIKTNLKSGFGKAYVDSEYFDFESFSFSEKMLGRDRRKKLQKYKDPTFQNGRPKFRYLQEGLSIEDRKHCDLTKNQRDWVTSIIINLEVAGEWKCAKSLPEEKKDLTPIFYLESTNSIIIPQSYFIPDIIKRALISCSGVPPTFMPYNANGNHYRYISGRFNSQRARNEKINAYKFDFIPKKIAEKILEKISCYPMERVDLIID